VVGLSLGGYTGLSLERDYPELIDVTGCGKIFSDAPILTAIAPYAWCAINVPISRLPESWFRRLAQVKVSEGFQTEMRKCASFKLGKDIAHSLATDYRPSPIRARSLAGDGR
jgi:hypothetical protein